MSRAASELPGAAPEQLGGYELLHPIGRGIGSAIFLARRAGSDAGQTFAFKVLFDALAGKPELGPRLLEAGRVVARLRHRSIAEVYDCGTSGAAFFVAMEQLAGWDLGAVRRRLLVLGRRFPVELAFRIAAEACAGLAHVHDGTASGASRPILHGGFSPSNVMVTQQGIVKLLDFGISALVGTPAARPDREPFWAPEQLRGEPPDARTDLFSLGVTLFVLLTGWHPFQRGSVATTRQAMVNDEPRDPRTLRPDLPEGVVTLLRRMLEPDRARRIGSAAELAAALATELARLPPPAAGSPPRPEGAADLVAFLSDLFTPEVDTSPRQLATRLGMPVPTFPARAPAPAPAAATPAPAPALTPAPAGAPLAVPVTPAPAPARTPAPAAPPAGAPVQSPWRSPPLAPAAPVSPAPALVTTPAPFPAPAQTSPVAPVAVAPHTPAPAPPKPASASPSVGRTTLWAAASPAPAPSEPPTLPPTRPIAPAAPSTPSPSPATSPVAPGWPAPSPPAPAPTSSVPPGWPAPSPAPTSSVPPGWPVPLPTPALSAAVMPTTSPVWPPPAAGASSLPAGWPAPASIPSAAAAVWPAPAPLPPAPAAPPPVPVGWPAPAPPPGPPPKPRAEPGDGQTTEGIPMRALARQLKRRSLALGVAIGAVALVGTFGLLALRRGREAPAPEPGGAAAFRQLPSPPAPPPPPVEVPEEAPVEAPPPVRHLSSLTGPSGVFEGKVLQKILRKARKRFAACLRFHGDSPSRSRRQLAMFLRVNGNGRVTQADVNLVGTGDDGLATCLESEATRLRFPKFPEKEVRFSFPVLPPPPARRR